MNYLKLLNQGLKETNFKELDKIAKEINQKDLIAIIGNGGSCATAEHLACDLNNIGYKAIALTSSPTITAIGNDIGFKYIYKKQLLNLKPKILICISATGNSKDIFLPAIIKDKMKVISFTGFDGGQLKPLSDYNIHVPINNYEIVEDIHLTICHMLKWKLRKEL